MDENELPPRVENEQPRVERETTIIQTGERRGSGGVIAAVLGLVVVAALAFFFLSGSFEKAADEVGVNVNVEAPDVDMPDINLPASEPATPANSN